MCRFIVSDAVDDDATAEVLGNEIIDLRFNIDCDFGAEAAQKVRRRVMVFDRLLSNTLS